MVAGTDGPLDAGNYTLVVAAYDTVFNTTIGTIVYGIDSTGAYELWVEASAAVAERFPQVGALKKLTVKERGFAFELTPEGLKRLK